MCRVFRLNINSNPVVTWVKAYEFVSLPFGLNSLILQVVNMHFVVLAIVLVNSTVVYSAIRRPHLRYMFETVLLCARVEPPSQEFGFSGDFLGDHRVCLDGGEELLGMGVVVLA